MRKVGLLGVCALVAASIAACSGGEDDVDQGVSARNLTVVMSTVGSHLGKQAMVRFKSGDTVAACLERGPITGPPFTLVEDGALTEGVTYDVIELVLGKDTAANAGLFNASVDHTFSHSPVTVTTDLVLTFEHGAALHGWTAGPATPITWVDGMGCPGE